MEITSKRKDVTLSILIDPRTTYERFILPNAFNRCGLVAIRKYDFNIIDMTSRIQTLPPLNTSNPSAPESKTTFYVYYVFLKIDIQIQSRRIEKTKLAWPWSSSLRILIETIAWQVEMNIVQQAKLGGLFKGKLVRIRVKGSIQFIELWFEKKEYSIVIIIPAVKFWYNQSFFINGVFIYWRAP